MNSQHHKRLGQFGEELAVNFLQKKGCTILERNFSSKYGEIDIIALSPTAPETILCVEVKTRVSNQFGPPEEAITRQKIKKLYNTACSYFYMNKINGKHFRIDALAIAINKITKKAHITYIKGLSYEEPA